MPLSSATRRRPNLTNDTFATSARHASAALTALLVSFAALSIAPAAGADPPRTVILCIGDGMGPEHVRAAGLYLNGKAGTLSFEAFPAQGLIRTRAADNPITDSAAAGTAMATGHRVNNGVISVQLPGDGHALTTILERAQHAGKRVGLVTTTELTHATPAAFAAHTPSREQRAAIARDYLQRSKPDVLLGGGGAGMIADDAKAAGYTVVENRAELQDARRRRDIRLCGLFGPGNMPYEYDDHIGIARAYTTFPHLHEMAMTAIDLLQESPNGFFLLVEGGRIDHAAHDHELERNILETVEFNRTVRLIIEWASGRDDTLIIITADHETGGMAITGKSDRGEFPDVTWSTPNHTSVDVGVYAAGTGASLFIGSHDNTDLPGLIAKACDPARDE